MKQIVHYTKDGVALEPDEGFTWMKAPDYLAAMQEKDLILHRAEEAWREEVRVRSLEQYEQGQKDERGRIRRFIVGLTTTSATRHIVETILWHIDKDGEVK